MKINPLYKPFSILISLFLLFILLSSLHFSWIEAINEAIIDWQFTLRGEREISDNYLLVFIGDEDIKAMNGWPVTRDYYSYLIHILNRYGARTIGIDVLFSNPDIHHPEYDRILEQFITSATNVCLPFTFSELTPAAYQTNDNNLALLTGKIPTLPIENLYRSARASGFSNFGRMSIIRKVPLAVSWKDSVELSFGLAMARTYLNSTTKPGITASEIILPIKNTDAAVIKTDRLSMIRLNHFGDIGNIQTMSAIDLMKTYEMNPDTLDFKNKLVLIAVTASGIANLKTTPLSDGLPASLIHLTIAENCLNGNYIQEMPLMIQWLILLIVFILMFLIHRIQKDFSRYISIVIFIMFYFLITIFVFANLNSVIPLFLPGLAMLTIIIYSTFLKTHEKKIEDKSYLDLLREQIVSKEIDLEATRDQLKKMATELEKEVTVSDQSRRLAMERKETIQRLENEINDLNTYVIESQVPASTEFPEIIYADKSPMKQVIDLVNKIRTDDIPVLLTGETGTGKEMIARAIHKSSRRQQAVFVAINCGALSENLLESELFGHEKGSFTGAQTRRKGRFEIADGGTIFLDEITETSTAFQTRLLRVLQDKTFERLGGEQTQKTDVRVIAASNKDLNQEMKSNRFRSDLFYRLNGFPINLPPLRERPEDIPLLANHFLIKHKLEKITGISDQAIVILQSYTWPGNVRELENCIHRSAILAQSENRRLIQENDLPDELISRDQILDRQNIHNPLEDQILEMLRSLKFSHAAISQTARILGNRDRGTVTEYFRGICFEQLVKSDFNLDAAAAEIAASADTSVREKVRMKLEEYINNIKQYLPSNDFSGSELKKLPPAYQGLPKKYHIYLDQVFQHFTER